MDPINVRLKKIREGRVHVHLKIITVQRILSLFFLVVWGLSPIFFLSFFLFSKDHLLVRIVYFQHMCPKIDLRCWVSPRFSTTILFYFLSNSRCSGDSNLFKFKICLSLLMYFSYSKWMIIRQRMTWSNHCFLFFSSLQLHFNSLNVYMEE